MILSLSSFLCSYLNFGGSASTFLVQFISVCHLVCMTEAILIAHQLDNDWLNGFSMILLLPLNQLSRSALKQSRSEWCTYWASLV